MEIKNKFNIGDDVYVISNNSDYWEFQDIEETCPICNGTEYIVVNGYEFRCPWCYHQHKYTYVPRSLKIKSMEIKIYRDSYHIIYEIDYDDWDYKNEYFTEKNVFATLEEAIAECKKRNAKRLEEYKVKGETQMARTNFDIVRSLLDKGNFLDQWICETEAELKRDITIEEENAYVQSIVDECQTTMQDLSCSIVEAFNDIFY